MREVIDYENSGSACLIWADFHSLIKKKSKAELLYARHKFRAKKCLFRAARKRAMNEQLNDGN